MTTNVPPEIKQITVRELVRNTSNVLARVGAGETLEVTRNGEPVRTARFMASRVVALVEHPASEDRGKPKASEESA